MKNLLNIKAMLALFGIVLSFIASNGNAAQSTVDIDQSDICPVDDWNLDVTSQCKIGQKIVFVPKSWGNEQLPLKFVGVNCDLKYSVAMTNGGVVCIYKPIKPTKI